MYRELTCHCCYHNSVYNNTLPVGLDHHFLPSEVLEQEDGSLEVDWRQRVQERMETLGPGFRL